MGEAFEWIVRVIVLGLAVWGALDIIGELSIRQPRCPQCGLRHGPAHRQAHHDWPDQERIP